MAVIGQGVWAAQLADHDSSRIAAGPASTTTTVSTTQPTDVAFDELLMSQWGNGEFGTMAKAADAPASPTCRTARWPTRRPHEPEAHRGL